MSDTHFAQRLHQVRRLSREVPPPHIKIPDKLAAACCIVEACAANLSGILEEAREKLGQSRWDSPYKPLGFHLNYIIL